VATNSTQLRLTRRGRLVVTLLILMLIIPVVSAGAAAVADQLGTPQAVIVHTVAPGETLWEIAQAHKKPSVGTWDAIAQIKRLNHIDTSDLYVGQTILISAD